ncbi:MAG: hypothetical protein ACR2FY_13810 [Pirellulaceae bacterium]
MKRIIVLSFAIALGAMAFANPADACHHRRQRRHGCHHSGGCGNGGYAPAYYDGKGGYDSKGGYADPGVDSGVPAPPPPPPAPRAT